MQTIDDRRVTLRQLLVFFLPLGLSASLVTISHVIINGTLARSLHPEAVIAAYTIAMSMLGFTERPAVLLRQTCSALVRDRRSFRAMSAVAWTVLGSIFIYGLVISYTPAGEWIFRSLFGADEHLLPAVLAAYRVLMFVSIFSGIRCLYHGIIISNMRTKWLTIGMIIRLAGMYVLSLWFTQIYGVKGAWVGAVIFSVGMAIEAALSFGEGHRLYRRMPDVREDHAVSRPRDIFSFYRPLLLSSFVAVWIGPVISKMMGYTDNLAVSLASFGVAGSLTQLVMSFFSYLHQIVLNFYRKDAAAVRRFALLFGFMPALLLGVMAYTSVGPWIMQHVLGISGNLLNESMRTLRVFMLMTLAFPWLDIGNGLLMLQGQTKVMLRSQLANLTATVLTLAVFVSLAPGWNGAIAALAQSGGVVAELCTVYLALYLGARNQNQNRLPGARGMQL